MGYAIIIHPVSRHQSGVVKLISRILGPAELKKAKELANKGGVVAENLNQEAATNFADQLKELGAQVEVKEMKGDNDGGKEDSFEVKLVDAGENKFTLVNVLKEITGLDLLDSKELIDKLGIVAKNCSEKEAKRIKDRLEAKGAKVTISTLMSPEPEPEPENKSAKGLQIGTVINSQGDPEGKNRILVRLPSSSGDEGVWCRLSSLIAAKTRDIFYKPEVDDEVIVGFLNDDPQYAVVLGMLHGSEPAPITPKEENDKYNFITKNGLGVIINDETEMITVVTPNGNEIKLSDDEGSIKISDENGNSIEMNSSGMTIESIADINIKATGDVNIEGSNLKFKAGLNLACEGGSGAEFRSSGMTTIQGSMVKIN